LDTLAKQKECEIIAKWKPAIISHLYWCALSSGGSDELVVAKWKSLMSHILNIHEGHEDLLYPKCLHESLDGPRKKRWLKPSKYK
jgi:hypothetical protein